MSAASPIAAAPDDLVIDVPPSAEALKRGLIVAAIIAFITLVSSMMIFTMVRALLAGTGPWVIVIPLGLISLIFPVVLSTLINQGVFRPLMSGLRTVRFHLSAARLDVLYNRGLKFSWPRETIRDVMVHLAQFEKGAGVYELRIVRDGEPQPVSLLYGVTERELGAVATRLREALHLESRESRAAHYLESSAATPAAPVIAPLPQPSNADRPVLPYAPQPDQPIVDRTPGRLRVMLPAPPIWPTIRMPLAFIAPIAALIFYVSMILPIIHGRFPSFSAILLWPIAAAITIGWGFQRFRDVMIDISPGALVVTRRGAFGARVQSWPLDDIREMTIHPDEPTTIKLCVVGGQIVNLIAFPTAEEAKSLAAQLRPALGFPS